MPKAKLFQHGGSQAVRLPKAFRFEGDEVNIERVPGGVLLSTMQDRLAAFDAAMAQLAELRDPAHPFHHPERPSDDDDLHEPKL